jgi:hypothetical protein
MGVFPISAAGLTGQDAEVVMAPPRDRLDTWEKALLIGGTSAGLVVFVICFPVWWWKRRRARTRARMS